MKPFTIRDDELWLKGPQTDDKEIVEVEAVEVEAVEVEVEAVEVEAVEVELKALKRPISS